MLSVTTQGLREIGQFRNRLAREYGRKRMEWDDFTFITERLIDIEQKLLDMAEKDPRRIVDDDKEVS